MKRESETLPMQESGVEVPDGALEAATAADNELDDLDAATLRELADQAQYYTGECLFSKSQYSDALNDFGLVEKNYPKSQLVPSSRLKMALCLEQLQFSDLKFEIDIALIPKGIISIVSSFSSIIPACSPHCR